MAKILVEIYQMSHSQLAQSQEMNKQTLGCQLLESFMDALRPSCFLESPSMQAPTYHLHLASEGQGQRPYGETLCCSDRMFFILCSAGKPSISPGYTSSSGARQNESIRHATGGPPLQAFPNTTEAGAESVQTIKTFRGDCKAQVSRAIDDE